MTPASALGLVAILVWGIALLAAGWRATRAAPRGPRSRCLPEAAAGAESLRLARRLYVSMDCGASLQAGLSLVIAAQPAGLVRLALQSRLRHLQRHATAARIPRWRHMPEAGCPRALRALDDLLTGRSTRAQALADWRIELLSAGLVDVPKQELGAELGAAAEVAPRGRDE